MAKTSGLLHSQPRAKKEDRRGGVWRPRLHHPPSTQMGLEKNHFNFYFFIFSSRDGGKPPPPSEGVRIPCRGPGGPIETATVHLAPRVQWDPSGLCRYAGNTSNTNQMTNFCFHSPKGGQPNFPLVMPWVLFWSLWDAAFTASFAPATRGTKGSNGTA